MVPKDLSVVWDACWPGVAPLANSLHRLASLESVWIRFHSLPGSKRYAESDDEAAEILSRHHVVLADLGLADRCFVSTSWYGPDDASGLTVARAPEIHARSTPWRTVDPKPDEDGTEVFLRGSLETYPSASVDDLLSKVADERLSGVMILPAHGRWIYRPYDGGADVFAQSKGQRDRLENAHRAWLSPHASGR